MVRRLVLWEGCDIIKWHHYVPLWENMRILKWSLSTTGSRCVWCDITLLHHICDSVSFIFIIHFICPLKRFPLKRWRCSACVHQPVPIKRPADAAPGWWISGEAKKGRCFDLVSGPDWESRPGETWAPACCWGGAVLGRGLAEGSALLLK